MVDIMGLVEGDITIMEGTEGAEGEDFTAGITVGIMEIWATAEGTETFERNRALRRAVGTSEWVVEGLALDMTTTASGRCSTAEMTDHGTTWTTTESRRQRRGG